MGIVEINVKKDNKKKTDDSVESLSPGGFVRFGSDGERVDQRLRVVFADVHEQLVNEFPHQLSWHVDSSDELRNHL